MRVTFAMTWRKTVGIVACIAPAAVAAAAALAFLPRVASRRTRRAASVQRWREQSDRLRAWTALAAATARGEGEGEEESRGREGSLEVGGLEAVLLRVAAADVLGRSAAR